MSKRTDNIIQVNNIFHIKTLGYHSLTTRGDVLVDNGVNVAIITPLLNNQVIQTDLFLLNGAGYTANVPVNGGTIKTLTISGAFQYANGTTTRYLLFNKWTQQWYQAEGTMAADTPDYFTVPYDSFLKKIILNPTMSRNWIPLNAGQYWIFSIGSEDISGNFVPIINPAFTVGFDASPPLLVAHFQRNNTPDPVIYTPPSPLGFTLGQNITIRMVAVGNITVPTVFAYLFVQFIINTTPQ